MGVPIIIFYRRDFNSTQHGFHVDFFWRFPSISRAAEFVKELAEWELQKSFKKKYISNLMLNAEDWVFNAICPLDIGVYREIICPECCSCDCDFDSDSDSDDYCPTCSDTDSDVSPVLDSDDHCPTCSDSDSDE